MKYKLLKDAASLLEYLIFVLLASGNAGGSESCKTWCWSVRNHLHFKWFTDKSNFFHSVAKNAGCLNELPKESVYTLK